MRRFNRGGDDDDGSRRRLSRKNNGLPQHATASDSFALRQLLKERNKRTTNIATINVGIVDAAATITTTTTRELSFLEDTIQLARTTYKIPRSIEHNFMDWNSKINYDSSGQDDKGLPIFWHILKSGGTTIKLMYAQCYHLVEACETGVLISNDDNDVYQQRRRHQKQDEKYQQQGMIEDSFKQHEQRRLIPMQLLTSEGEGGANADAPVLSSPPLSQSIEEKQRQQQQLLRIVISEDGRKYVNVDVTTFEGIHRAFELGFASSQLADVIFTPLLLESAELLFNSSNNSNDDSTVTRRSRSNTRKGRMFALFRHPIQRVTSIFYYLQSATWEPTYNPEYAQWTIHDYAKSPYCESNWMVRSLVQKMTGPLVAEDVLVAQEILRRKCLVGLMEDMEESIRRFHSLYFHPHFVGQGAKEAENAAFSCAIEHFAKKGLSGQNSHGHPTLDETSETWEILATKNQLDIQLYEYAKELYFEQGKWMKQEKVLI